ncbi:MAG: hypothetical protein QW223_08080 [Candidatus Caldarchaeum sp.]
MPTTITTKDGEKVRLPSGFRRWLAGRLSRRLRIPMQPNAYKFAMYLLTKRYRTKTVRKLVRQFKQSRVFRSSDFF